jgi:hypothetical protein
MKYIDKTTAIEYCSVCGSSGTMSITMMPRLKAATEDGGSKVMIVKTYHCESCRSFVRNTEEELSAV